MAWRPFLKHLTAYNANRNIAQYIKSTKERLTNSSLFHKHLFWTNLGISVILSGLGDFLIQQRETNSSGRPKGAHPATKSLNATNSFRLEFLQI